MNEAKVLTVGEKGIVLDLVKAAFSCGQLGPMAARLKIPEKNLRHMAETGTFMTDEEMAKVFTCVDRRQDNMTQEQLDALFDLFGTKLDETAGVHMAFCVIALQAGFINPPMRYFGNLDQSEFMSILTSILGKEGYDVVPKAPRIATPFKP